MKPLPNPMRKYVSLAAGLLLSLALAESARADNAVTRWMDLALRAVAAQNIGTPSAGRLYAMVTVAMYDAVNGIDTARQHGRQPALVPAAGAPMVRKSEITSWRTGYNASPPLHAHN